MTVAVIGGGVQGACIALELARRGIASEIIEREPACVTQAGAQNEGKIHLGFVFANDTSFATAKLMLQGAAVFEPSLRDWIGRDLQGLRAERSFTYLVHRDSLVSADQLEARYRRIAELAGEAFNGAPRYFGENPAAPPARIGRSAFEKSYDPERGEAAIATPEVAIDSAALAAALRARLEEEPLVELRLGATVRGADPRPDSVEIAFETADGCERRRYDHAVNASWDSQVAIDRAAGVAPDPNWSYRTKFALRTDIADAALPSTTIVLGPFGDIVNYGPGGLYLSWYPVGRIAMTGEERPRCWPRAPDSLEKARIAQGIVGALSGISPALGAVAERIADSARLCGGVIFAAGRRDVHDPESGLHARTAIGVRHFGRYHSVNAGKLTTAPLFARRLAAHIAGE